MIKRNNIHFYVIPVEARLPMMTKLAIEWNGQWFLKINDIFGLEAAVEINTRVRASWSKMEMQAVLRALDKQKAENLSDALAVWRAYAYQMFGFDGDAFEGEQTLENDTILFTMSKCAALEGAKRVGLKHSSQTCIACSAAWKSWFETLLPDYEISNEIISQMGFGAPKCDMRIRALPKNS